MKNSLTITAIAALHIAVGLLIFAQSGCNSASDQKTEKDVNAEIVPANEEKVETAAPVQEEAPEGSSALRANPTRPVWSMDNGKNKPVIVENQPSTVSPKSQANEGLIAPSTLTAKSEKQLPENTKMYTVAKGDSLGKIARRHNTTVSKLKSLNSLSSLTIKVGQELIVPANPSDEVVNQTAPKAQTMASVESVGTDTIKYKVQKGDSLGKIAKRHNTTVSQIKALNNLKNDTIRIGQTLTLEKSGKAVSETKASAKTEAQKSEVAGNFEVYKVQKGDTLGAIARKNKVSLSQIEKLNPSINPKRLKIGQLVKIKAAAEVKEQPKPQATPEQPKVEEPKQQVQPTVSAAPAAPTAAAENKVEQQPKPVQTQPAQPVQVQQTTTPAPEPKAGEEEVIEI